MKLYYPIEVDLFRPYPLPIMEAQQNNVGRGAQVTLKANGSIIQPTNEGLTFWAKKPDGTVSYLAATLSGTNVQLDFTNQMLALPGMDLSPCAPLVTPCMFVISTRMISEKPMVAMAR